MSALIYSKYARYSININIAISTHLNNNINTLISTSRRTSITLHEGTDDMEKAEHSNANQTRDEAYASHEQLDSMQSISRASKATIFGRRSSIFGKQVKPIGTKNSIAHRASVDARERRFGSMTFDPQGVFELTVEVVVERLYMVHVIRVVLVLALFSLTSIAALCEDDDVNALDRLALLVRANPLICDVVMTS